MLRTVSRINKVSEVITKLTKGEQREHKVHPLPLTLTRPFSAFRFDRHDSKVEFETGNTNIPDGENPGFDYGLKQFVKRMYLWTGGGIVGTAGISILGHELFYSHPIAVVTGGLILGFGGAYGVTKTKYTIHQDVGKTSTGSVDVLYTTNSPKRIAAYAGVVSGMGMLGMPLCAMFPYAVIPAFIASTSVFGGTGWYAMTRKVGEFKPWAGVMYGGITGLIGVSAVGMSSSIIFGFNMFGIATHLIGLYGGVPVITGLVAYNTYKAIELYRAGDADHLGCSVRIHLDILNLLIKAWETVGDQVRKKV